MSYAGEGDADDGLVWNGTKQVWAPVLLRDGSTPMEGPLDMGGEVLGNVKNVNYAALYGNGNSGAAIEIDWENGQKQTLTLTDDAALTFVGGVAGGNYVLDIAQDATGGWVPTWPGNVKASGGLVDVAIAVNAETTIGVFFDGSFYKIYASPGMIAGVTTNPV